MWVDGVIEACVSVRVMQMGHEPSFPPKLLRRPDDAEPLPLVQPMTVPGVCCVCVNVRAWVGVGV
jgi:hypothetical protein